MIEVKNITKKFSNRTAVHPISFHVGLGEVVCLLGPNGAGKSTTMRMLTGYLTPNTGQILIGAYDLALEPVAARRKIGYLPENAPLYSDMTVKEFLLFMANIRGIHGPRALQRVYELCELMDIKNVVNQVIDTLSKGYRQRVGIAQAIVHDPEVLILDEPTDGLDPNQKIMVRDLIRHMGKEKVIIFSTHILEEVLAVANRVIILSEGRIKNDEAIEEILTRGSLEETFRTLTSKQSTIGQ